VGSRQLKPRATLTGRFVSGRRLDRNPLRRTSDRAESLVLLLLVVGFLVTAPLAALASGGWTHAMAQRAELAQAASRRQVTAVVLTAAALPRAGSGSLVADVQARWTAPDGTVATGQVPVPVGTAAGRDGPR
jgi:hypothetical protein